MYVCINGPVDHFQKVIVTCSAHLESIELVWEYSKDDRNDIAN